MTTNQQQTAERILIYRLGSLGDTIVALPSLRLVARAFPKAQRWMLTNSCVSEKQVPVAQILENTGLIQGYIRYQPKLHNPLKLLTLQKRLRSLRLDVMVYLAAPRGRIRILRDALFFKMCGIKRLIGVPYKKALQHSVFMGDGTYEYEGSRLLRCIQPLGTIGLDDPSVFDLRLEPSEYESAKTKLNGFETNRPYIVASIGAKVDVKDWGDSNWKRLISKLGKQLTGWGLIMIGSADEKERTSKLLLHWAGNRLNSCNNLNVREAGAVLSKAQLFIGHDSGPMHLAAAVNTTCIVIFSSRNLPGEWFPPGSQHRILYRPVNCMGCKLEECIHLRKKCIRSISVTEVYDQVIQVVQNSSNSLLNRTKFNQLEI